MIDSEYSWLLGRFIKVTLTQADQTMFSLNGKITKTTNSTITLTCAAAETYQDLNHKEVKVEVFADYNVLSSFKGKIINHFVDREEKKELLIMDSPTEAEFNESRTKLRVNVKLPVTMQLIALGNQSLPIELQRKYIRGIIRDISEGGAQVVSTIKIPKNLQVLINVELPSNRKLMLKAELLWSQAHKSGYQYGFRFLGVDLQHRSMLRQIIYDNF